MFKKDGETKVYKPRDLEKTAEEEEPERIYVDDLEEDEEEEND